ncbi:hypothetical protein ANCCAN_23191 [Ancylostoma caninum]|uniref:Uncharacterized protein n=1 Tax=Ancylostoma caninum TaxID=29170 RepID=A0A368FJ89_ANCCA|nr:hypothetical protein ANCCAN_23191 [Ancylostoma caninum]
MSIPGKFGVQLKWSFGRFRRGADAPIAHSLRTEARDIRRRPPLILNSIGPLAVGKRDGDDAKMVVPGLGTFGLGDVKSSIAKFIPAGTGDQVPNGGTFELSDKPNLGYMDRETTAGRSSGSTSKMSFGGIGTLELGQEKEQGTGLLDFSKTLFPFLQLPPLKNDETQEETHTAVDPKLAELYYPKPKSYVDEAEKFLEENPKAPETPFNKVKEIHEIHSKDLSADTGNPFDRIKSRPGYPGRARVHAVKTVTEDEDLLPKNDPFTDKASEEGFIKQQTKERVTDQDAKTEPIPGGLQNIATEAGRVPLSQLGLSKKDVHALCAKFAPVAAKHCYGPKVDAQFLDKCRGYNEDCAQFQAQVDFGSWGGGYSDNLGVRDFWSQTSEAGANWYEGTYGYKSGWSIPIVQSAGVEGGGGTQVVVPLKEGELGRPIQATNGYHVGPYFGIADRVGVDWYNGGVSWNRGVASPFVGVGVNTGTSIGFPSIGTIMSRMGVRDMDQLSKMLAAGVQTRQTGAIGG